MANVMIKCPETGEAIRTGMDVDDESFQSLTLKDNAVGCSVCGEVHIYQKDDAYLGS